MTSRWVGQQRSSWKITEVVEGLTDPYADMISADGISSLCNDLQADQQDIVMVMQFLDSGDNLQGGKKVKVPTLLVPTTLK
ncbi:hypothetical protein Dimus_020373, partial [Dionaea muscipula]